MIPRLLVTGGGGYLGTVAVRQLLAQGYRVRVLDRFDHGAQPLVGVSRWPQLEMQRGDVRDYESVARALDGCAAVIHLAGIVGYPACAAAPDEAHRTNVHGTEAVCAAAGTRRVILASTTSIYGEQAGSCTEQTAPNPRSVYGQTKRLAEEMVYAQRGVILRFATLFGPSPRLRWDVLPHDFAWKAARERILEVYQPEALRQFLHVEDAARALIWALDAPPQTVWNVGDPRSSCTKGELGEALRGLTGCALATIDGADPEARTYAVDFSAIHAEGLWPRYTLKQALPGIVEMARVWEEREG